MLLLRCMTSWRQKTSDQRLNNIVYVNERIYKVEQRQINVIYFEVDLNNFVIFNVDFHTLGKVETRLWIWQFVKNQKNKLRAKNIIILSFKWKSFKLNTLKANFSSLYYPFQGIYVEEYLQTVKILKTLWYAASQKQYLNHFTLQNMNFFLTSQED